MLLGLLGERVLESVFETDIHTPFWKDSAGRKKGVGWSILDLSSPSELSKRCSIYIFIGHSVDQLYTHAREEDMIY